MAEAKIFMEFALPSCGFQIAEILSAERIERAFAKHDASFGPYEGKETGESVLLRAMLLSLDEGDLCADSRAT